MEISLRKTGAPFPLRQGPRSVNGSVTEELDSAKSDFTFRRVDEFTPGQGAEWVPFGRVAQCVAEKNNTRFTLTGISDANHPLPPVLQLQVLGPQAFRVRFNPQGDYSHDASYAVVNKNLGDVSPRVVKNDAEALIVNLGEMEIKVPFDSFAVQVYRNGQLISGDTGKGLVYQPGGEAVADFKSYPKGAYYFGFGEKGGRHLRMNETSLTFFNYDNYKYAGADYKGPRSHGDEVVPAAVKGDESTRPGPLNPSEPLYTSIPFLIEEQPQPIDASGKPYSYGIFFDNPAQSYFNVGKSTQGNPDMDGKYYFGALHGDLDYYFLGGENTPEVLRQYKTLTGPANLPPMWALGYHQGGYGYYDHSKVMEVASGYRQAHIPLDGIHIDIDWENNYQAFQVSPRKFPDGGRKTFQALSQMGIKASLNVTPMVSAKPMDESGAPAANPVLQSGLAVGAFLRDQREPVKGKTAPQNPPLFTANVSYGLNQGSNPYPTPDAGSKGPPIPLGTYGYIADLGRPEVREWWGRQYKPLLDAGLEMVWQDMTDPATAPSQSDPMPWKTLPLDLQVTDSRTGEMTAHARIHNALASNLVSATFEGLTKLREESGVDKRNFIVARGGYAGIQRYAANWTGDSGSDWDNLAIQIPEILNFGLSGQPLAGADVGGFAVSSASSRPGSPPIQGGRVVGGITDPELLTRWTALSSFFGWFRNHYDGYAKEYQEPFKYPEPVVDNCRKHIENRYKSLQLFYDAMHEATENGLPICRPLFLTDRSDPQVYRHLDDQFMVGQNLLVAPVVTKGSLAREVYLPANSRWYAHVDNETSPLKPSLAGGQSVNCSAPLDVVPQFVRAGAILPRRKLEQYVGELPSNPLTFEVYPGPASTYKLYLDDKVSTQANKNQAYRLTELSQKGDSAHQEIRIQRLHDQFTPKEEFYTVALLDRDRPQSILVNGAPVTLAWDPEDLERMTGTAAAYDPALRTTFVKVLDASTDTTIQANWTNSSNT